MGIKQVQQLVEAAGGKIDSIGGPLPDGSGFATASFPLPSNHWFTQEHSNVPPMPFRMGTTDERRKEWAEKIRVAARYAVRAATMNGKEMDFDPDAMLQCLVVGMLGYWTEDGLSYYEGKEEKWANPQPHPPIWK